MTSQQLNDGDIAICRDKSKDALILFSPMSVGDSKDVSSKLYDNSTNELKKAECKNEKCSSLPEPPDLVEQDGYYAWVIVAAAFTTCWIIGVMFIAFSILYMDFVDHFEQPRGVTGWIGSLYLATGNIFGILFSVFVKQYGCRVVCVIGGVLWSIGFAASSLAVSITYLYFSYGVVAGMGFNMVTLSSFVVVQQHFTRRRALAAGIASAGISIGSLSSGPIIALLTNQFGWRGTLLIMSSLTLNSCAFGILYRPPRSLKVRVPKVIIAENNDIALASMENGMPESVEKELLQPIKNGSAAKTAVPLVHSKETVLTLFYKVFKGTFNVSIFLNCAFTLVCFGTFFMNIGTTIFYQHTPSRAKSVGIDRSEVVLIPSAVGVATFISRLIGAAIGNCRCTDRTLQYGVSILVAGVFFIASAHANTFMVIAVLGAAIGSLIGFSLTVQTTVMSDLVGVENVARAQAFILIFTGVGALIAVPLAGFMFDRTGDYIMPFYTGGCLQMLGGALSVVGAVVTRIRLCKKN